MQKRITYLLGAGASCNSQPLVSDMKDRMVQLLYLLDPNNGTSSASNLKESTLPLYNKFLPIVTEANKHHTIDTYARKLWLTHEKEKLDLLKDFLNLYFLFEQDFQKSSYAKFPHYPDEPLWDKIGTTLDYRYDVFFATLLKNENDVLVLPENISIISWNYDNQLEFAYREFLKDKNIEDIQTLLNIFPANTGMNIRKDKSKIIKLNGYCNIADFDTNGNIEEITFEKQLKILLEGGVRKKTINFAWENIEDLKMSQSHAIEIIKQTTDLIVIGYSFPNFNREIDRLFIESSDFNKIFIQVPNVNEFKVIKDRISRIAEYIYDDLIFTHIDDSNQFFIPM